MRELFRVGDAWWMIRFTADADLPADADGLCDHEEQIITIRSGMSPDRQRMVVLHEAAHAACPYLTEEAIDRLGLAQHRAVDAADNLTRF